MNPICFYHKADLDGVCSGAIVKHFVPDCGLYGFDYGEKFNWDLVRPGPDAENDPLWAHLFKQENGYEGPAQNGGYAVESIRCEKRTVYMVDVSLPPEDMKRLAEVSNLIWIDHHKSCEELWNGINPLGMFRTNRAACELTWEWCVLAANPSNEPRWLANNLKTQPFREIVPEAVRLLGRYDVWDKDHPDWEAKILPFQYGCRAVPGIYSPENLFWKYQFQNTTEKDGTRWMNFREGTVVPNPEWVDLVGKGRAILRYQAEVNHRACEAGAYVLGLRLRNPAPYANAWWFGSADELRGHAWNPGDVLDLRVLACNTIVFNSQFFDGFYDPEKHDVMCAYAQIKVAAPRVEQTPAGELRYLTLDDRDADVKEGTTKRALRPGHAGYETAPLALGVIMLRDSFAVAIPQTRWKVSLYSTKPEIDCGAICKTFGGGGHKGAAGFICDRLPWEEGSR